MDFSTSISLPFNPMGSQWLGLAMPALCRAYYLSTSVHTDVTCACVCPTNGDRMSDILAYIQEAPVT